MKRIIGYIFIGGGFLLTGSFGVGMVGCISVVHEVFFWKLKM